MPDANMRLKPAGRWSSLVRLATTGDRQTHDRFIIIDGKEVFKVGTSAKDLGVTMAQSSVDMVNDPDVTAEYIKQFDEWWCKASNYPGLS